MKKSRIARPIAAVESPMSPGQTVGADDLIAHCRRELAAHTIPRSIAFLDELPKSSALKILRRELRDREIAVAAAQPPTS